MLSLLAKQGMLRATDLQAPFDVAQPTISKHLKVLEKAGLITRDIDGREHRFQLDLGPMNEALDWISRHREFWEGTLNSLERYMGRLDDDE